MAYDSLLGCPVDGDAPFEDDPSKPTSAQRSFWLSHNIFEFLRSEHVNDGLVELEEFLRADPSRVRIRLAVTKESPLHCYLSNSHVHCDPRIVQALLEADGGKAVRSQTIREILPLHTFLMHPSTGRHDGSTEALDMLVHAFPGALDLATEFCVSALHCFLTKGNGCACITRRLIRHSKRKAPCCRCLS